MAAPHKFKAGQRVRLLRGDQNMPYTARFTIVSCLPGDGRGLAYRIKGDGEGHERVAVEADLESMF